MYILEVSLPPASRRRLRKSGVELVTLPDAQFILVNLIRSI